VHRGAQTGLPRQTHRGHPRRCHQDSRCLQEGQHSRVFLLLAALWQRHAGRARWQHRQGEAGQYHQPRQPGTPPPRSLLVWHPRRGVPLHRHGHRLPEREARHRHGGSHHRGQSHQGGDQSNRRPHHRHRHLGRRPHRHLHRVQRLRRQGHR